MKNFYTRTRLIFLSRLYRFLKEGFELLDEEVEKLFNFKHVQLVIDRKGNSYKIDYFIDLSTLLFKVNFEQNNYYKCLNHTFTSEGSFSSIMDKNKIDRNEIFKFLINYFDYSKAGYNKKISRDFSDYGNRLSFISLPFFRYIALNDIDIHINFLNQMKYIDDYIDNFVMIKTPYPLYEHLDSYPDYSEKFKEIIYKETVL